MYAVKTGLITRVTKDNATENQPAGTIKHVYAIEGTPEELSDFEEKRGTYFRTFDDGIHAGKPRWSSIDCFDTDKTEVSINEKGYVNKVLSETDIQAEVNEQKIDRMLTSKKPSQQLRAKFALAAEYGVTMS
jgi:hypothetical protein